MGGGTLHDEIGFEFMGNHPGHIHTNVYANELLGGGHPQLTLLAPGSAPDFHVYRIRCLPGRVEWFVDGESIRVETTRVPTGPMHFHLNMWAPGSDWPEAYGADFQPVSDSEACERFYMIVDSVSIESVSL